MANFRVMAAQDAQRYGLNPQVFVRQIGAESNFNPGAVSPAGARGIAQFMPGTAAGMHINPGNPVQALDAAARLMSQYVKQYGSYRDALVAYNAGPGRVGKALPAETQAYVAKILGGSNPAPGGIQSPVARGGGGGGNPDAQLLNLLTTYAASAKNAQDTFALASGLAGLNSPVAKTPASYGASTGQQAPGAAKGGVAKFDGKPVAGWIAPILAYARQHGWQGTVTSGYRSDAQQKQIYDSGVRPAALPQAYGGHGSNHEFTAFPGGAVDVSNAQQLAQILSRSPFAGKLQWAGAKDPVHFSHAVNGSY